MKKRKARKPTRIKAKRVRREKLPLPDGFSIGCLVSYYDQGWRIGYFVEVRAAGHEMGIRPILGYKKSAAHNLTWHKVSDVKLAEGSNEESQSGEVSPKVRKRNRRVQVL